MKQTKFELYFFVFHSNKVSQSDNLKMLKVLENFEQSEQSEKVNNYLLMQSLAIFEHRENEKLEMTKGNSNC